MSRKRKQARLLLWGMALSSAGMYLSALLLLDGNYLAALVAPAAGLALGLAMFGAVQRLPADDPIRDAYDGLIEIWDDYNTRRRTRK